MRSGVIGICQMLAPIGDNASFTAFNIAAGAPPVPASPAPFAPSTDVFVGVSI